MKFYLFSCPTNPHENDNRYCFHDVLFYNSKIINKAEYSQIYCFIDVHFDSLNQSWVGNSILFVETKKLRQYIQKIEKQLANTGKQKITTATPPELAVHSTGFTLFFSIQMK